MELYRLIEEKMKEKSPVILAIDGRCAGGKSTLAQSLSERYKAGVVHVDDFFLRPEQRTEQRLKEIGGNVDRERFTQEVIYPLKEGRFPFVYGKYDCTVQKISGSVQVEKSPLMIVEGAYSCHPYFGDIYDIRVFVDVDHKTQKDRIIKRNGTEMLPRFLEEWIPKEEAYFQTFGIQGICDIVLSPVSA